MTILHRPLWVALLALLLNACGGGAPATPPAAPATTLALSAASSTATAGGQPVTLTATVSDASPVNWKLAAGNPGALSATTGASVNYLPPAGGVSAAVTVTITATANGASQSLVLTVSPDPDPPRLQLVAGDIGGPGTVDDIGTRARLGEGHLGAFDRDRNLYLVESDTQYAGGNGNRVAFRKVTPDGTVSTLLNATRGVVDGEAAVARADSPDSLAAGADGSVYFSDRAGDAAPASTVAVRKLERSGKISTIAHIPLAAGDALSLASDGGGKLYAVQRERISLIGADGSVTLLAGAAASAGMAVDGPGASARFAGLRAAAADAAGNLYLIDRRAVRKYALDGTVSTVAGIAADTGSAAVDGSGGDARFVAPYGIGVNAAGNIVLGDQTAAGDNSSFLLRTITPTGAVASVPLSTPSVNTDTLLVSPKGPVLRRRSYQIDALAADGSSVPLVGNRGSAARQDGSGGAARFIAPNLMAADSAGNLYVADRSKTTDYVPHAHDASGFYLRKITPAGTVTTLADLSTAGYPSGIAMDRNNTLYLSIRIASSSMFGLQPGGGVYKLQADGSLLLLAGVASNGGAYVQVDGAGTAARFVSPILEGADADGNLYVSDTPAGGGARTVRKVTPGGVVSTIAAMPAGLKNVADQAGNLYSADYTEHVVYRTTPAGVKTVVAGTPGQRGTLDGALPGHLLQPTALVATGPYSFALVSGNAVMKLVVPH